MYLTDELTNEALVKASRNGGQKMEIKTTHKIITSEENMQKKWVAVDDMIYEIDKLRADISNCIPNEYMVKYIDRFDKVSNALASKTETMDKDDYDAKAHVEMYP